MKLPLQDIAQWIGAELQGENRTATGYSIDTRTLSPGDLFFAVRGERYDAHDFVATALERGACAAVVSRSKATRPTVPTDGYSTDPLGVTSEVAQFTH